MRGVFCGDSSGLKRWQSLLFSVIMNMVKMCQEDTVWRLNILAVAAVACCKVLPPFLSWWFPIITNPPGSKERMAVTHCSNVPLFHHRPWKEASVANLATAVADSVTTATPSFSKQTWWDASPVFLDQARCSQRRAANTAARCGSAPGPQLCPLSGREKLRQSTDRLTQNWSQHTGCM